MPNLVEFRPARPAVPASISLRMASRTWRVQAASWFRSMAIGLGSRRPGDPLLEQFAGISAMAREPEEVRVALVRLAAEVSGASRVELLRDRGGRMARRLACWPPVPTHEPTADSASAPRGPIAPALGEVRKNRVAAADSTISLPLRAGEVHYATLRLTDPNRGTWPTGLERRLEALCAIAASAERALGAPRRSHPESPGDSEAGPQGSTILGAFLSFAHAQARRRREPLSFLEVAVDRLAAIRELLGDELAEMAIERVARAVKATVRASDVMARLEDGRLAVILPNASAENALRVAEAIRSAIARAGTGSTTMPTLTASIGVATFPDHAHDLATLRAAAATALTRAEDLGHDQIAGAIETQPAGVLEQLVG